MDMHRDMDTFNRDMDTFSSMAMNSLAIRSTAVRAVGVHRGGPGGGVSIGVGHDRW